MDETKNEEKKQLDKNNKKSIIEIIKAIVLPKLSEGTIKDLVNKEMSEEKYINTYDVNISTSSIIGYLGEV